MNSGKLPIGTAVHTIDDPDVRAYVGPKIAGTITASVPRIHTTGTGRIHRGWYDIRENKNLPLGVWWCHVTPDKITPDSHTAW